MVKEDQGADVLLWLESTVVACGCDHGCLCLIYLVFVFCVLFAAALWGGFGYWLSIYLIQLDGMVWCLYVGMIGYSSRLSVLVLGVVLIYHIPCWYTKAGNVSSLVLFLATVRCHYIY